MAKFVPRTTRPTTDNDFYYANNPFYVSGYGMPNCTCYAWGRFYEITGTRPKLSTKNAENWWAKADGYERGQTPKLGAVICWRKGQAGNSSDGAGHVAIVEAINEDGSIVTSESGWKSSAFWWTKTRKPGGRWGASEGYTFQGFIYCPIDFESEEPEEPTEPPVNLSFYSGNRWLTEEEMKVNAQYIWTYLSERGWSLNAVCGMLGNMEKESTINPGIWQGLNEGVGPAFGLVQWDPYTKYTNWCEENGLNPSHMNSALQRIEWEVENGEQYYKDDYPYTFKQFKVSTDDPYILACAFAFDYERSWVTLNGTEEQKEALRQERGGNAVKWYNFLRDIEPGTPDHPIVTQRRKGMSLLLMIAASRRRGV